MRYVQVKHWFFRELKTPQKAQIETKRNILSLKIRSSEMPITINDIPSTLNYFYNQLINIRLKYDYGEIVLL